MKHLFTCLFLLLMNLGLLAQDSPAEMKIICKIEGQSLKETLQIFEAVTGFTFVYSESAVAPFTFIHLDAKEMTLDKAMEKVLQGTGLEATFKEDMVVLHAIKSGAKAPVKSAAVAADQKFTIRGYVEEKGSGERLSGAAVYDQRTGRGVLTNQYGYFSLQLPSDSVYLAASYLGYAKYKQPLFLDQDFHFVLQLEPDLTLETVEITDGEVKPIERKTEMGTIELPMAQIKRLPSLLGEVDVIKTMQLLPGVQSGNEGSSFLYVRGGGPDQNLILLDGVPVYNAAHLFGIFSIFNADAIQDVKLVKGPFPARYGGRLSSVLDIRMREGNDQEFKSEASIGLTGAKVTVEGPIKKGKASFLVSGRRTLVDLITWTATRFSSSGYHQTYWFGDLNAKVNWRVGQKDRLYLSTYSGRDKFYTQNRSRGKDGTEIQDFGFQWGSRTTALRWNHEFSHTLFANFTATHSRYQYENFDHYTFRSTTGDVDRLSLDIQSGIRDFALRSDFDYFPNPRHHIRFGSAFMPRKFRPEVTAGWDRNLGASEVVNIIGDNDVHAIENYLYLEDDLELNDRLAANLGVHASHFHVGNSDYFSVQPRASARYLIDDHSSIKGGYSRMTQFMHLVSNSGVGLPTDLWIPVTDSFPPMLSHQFSLGYARSLPKHGLEFSVEAYYKDMDQLLEYRNGANFFTSNSWSEAMTGGGTGRSYGLELFVHKKQGRWNGFAGYTLSRTTRQFDELNGGLPFPYKYDRTHDASVALVYEARKGLEFSGSWVFGTGNAITFPRSLYLGSSNPWSSQFWGSSSGTPLSYPVLVDHGSRNGFRIPPYHRLDLNCTVTKERPWGQRLYHFGVYNAYSRRNPFFVYLAYDRAGTTTNAEIKARLVSLFPAIPYFTLHLKFK